MIYFILIYLFNEYTFANSSSLMNLNLLQIDKHDVVVDLRIGTKI